MIISSYRVIVGLKLKYEFSARGLKFITSVLRNQDTISVKWFDKDIYWISSKVHSSHKQQTQLSFKPKYVKPKSHSMLFMYFSLPPIKMSSRNTYTMLCKHRDFTDNQEGFWMLIFWERLKAVQFLVTNTFQNHKMVL